VSRKPDVDQHALARLLSRVFGDSSPVLFERTPDGEPASGAGYTLALLQRPPDGEPASGAGRTPDGDPASGAGRAAPLPRTPDGEPASGIRVSYRLELT